jgi:hypothetical protein
LLGSLSEAQGKQYKETGQVGPVPVLSAEEVIYFRSKMEAA